MARCPTCGGYLFLDEDRLQRCLSCGRPAVPVVPPEIPAKQLSKKDVSK